MRSLPQQRRRRAILAAVVAAAALAAPASAGFGASASESHSVSSGTIAAPTGVAAARGPCEAGTSASASLSWTASTSDFATGYEILRATASGGPYTSAGTVSGRTTTTFVDTGRAFLTTYYYVVRATRHAWESEDSSVVTHATESPLCV